MLCYIYVCLEWGHKWQLTVQMSATEALQLVHTSKDLPYFAHSTVPLQRRPGVQEIRLRYLLEAILQYLHMYMCTFRDTKNGGPSLTSRCQQHESCLHTRRVPQFRGAQGPLPSGDCRFGVKTSQHPISPHSSLLLKHLRHPAQLSFSAYAVIAH